MAASYKKNKIIVDVEDPLAEGNYNVTVSKEDGTIVITEPFTVGDGPDPGPIKSALVTSSYVTWSGNSGSTVRIDIKNTGEVDLENAVLIVESDMQIRNDSSDDYWRLSVLDNGPESLGGGRYRYRLQLEGETGSAITIPVGGTEWCGWNTTNPTPNFTLLQIEGAEITLPSEDPPATAPRPRPNTGKGFYTNGRGIYDSKGNRFIMRGINDMGVWFDTWGGTQRNVDARRNIANLGCNAIRITWDINYQTGQSDDNQRRMIDRLIQTCIDNKMVPLFEIQDSTGKTSDSEMLNTFVPWYIARADIWNKFEEHIIMNPFNEWGNDVMTRGARNRRRFPDVYKQVITAFRKAGIKSPIAIDPFNWGKDYTLIIDHGEEIANHDPQKNIIFSVHFYAGPGTDEAKIRDCIGTISKRGLPLIIGEFGDRRSSGIDIKEDTIMSECKEKNIGWLAWSWTENQKAHDLTKPKKWDADKESDLSDWGRRVFFGPNGIQQEAEIASIFIP